MDTSETYIKQSEKARKYLPKHEWEDGDFYYRLNGNFRIHGCQSLLRQLDGLKTDRYCNGCREVFNAHEDAENMIPLLRQDQLQEMVQPNDMSARRLLNQFALWSEQQKHDITNAFASMEQLWLAFVMKESYNNVWLNGEWVRE